MNYLAKPHLEQFVTPQHRVAARYERVGQGHTSGREKAYMAYRRTRPGQAQA